MLQKVREQRSDFNNSQAISKSPILSKAKLAYYYIVFIIYKIIGRFVDFAQANSTWTHEHMKKIWPSLHNSGKLTKLYPPCTVDRLLVLKKPDPTYEINIMSLAQFRPEKQQHLQLEVIAELVKTRLSKKIKLKMCGTTRGADDEAILLNLQAKASTLGMYNL
jgi:alpha-1,2-mannosyltransferase